MRTRTSRVTSTVVAGVMSALAAVSPISAGAPPDCGTYSGRGCGAASKRVDLARPTFSRPTAITNPLFPIGRLRSAVLLGTVDGEPFRSETTLLPGRGTVTLNGRRVRVRLSQYMAFVDGRLEEVALDRYAQADDGSVWYLGEDVFDYRNGAVVVTEGTWLAGRDGPAAMIMPAHPKAGDVFRPENIPGVVFEEVTVRAIDQRVGGPHGPVAGAMVGDELHLDGSHSPKTFAPGYGEFLTVDGADREALAVAAPTDALRGPMPRGLRELLTGAFGVLEDARLRNWEAASATTGRLSESWRNVAHKAPPLVARSLAGKLTTLEKAVESHRSGTVAQLTLHVARLALDVQLRYRPVEEVDAERFHLWTQQVRIHAAAHDVSGVTGDVAVLEWIRERLKAALSKTERSQLDFGLRGLRAAADARNLRATADHAARLGALVRRLAGP